MKIILYTIMPCSPLKFSELYLRTTSSGNCIRHSSGEKVGCLGRFEPVTGPYLSKRPTFFLMLKNCLISTRSPRLRPHAHNTCKQFSSCRPDCTVLPEVLPRVDGRLQRRWNSLLEVLPRADKINIYWQFPNSLASIIQYAQLHCCLLWASHGCFT